MQNFDSRKIGQAYADDGELGISKSRIFKSGTEIVCEDTILKSPSNGPYDKPYLKEGCKSRDYLKSVSYTVNMNGKAFLYVTSRANEGKGVLCLPLESHSPSSLGGDCL